MKALKKYYRKAVPALAIFALVALVAMVFRAVSIATNENSQGIKVPAVSYFKYVWLELKNIFKFSRY